MAPPLRECRVVLLWPEGGLKDKDWTQTKMKQWVSAAGGSLIISGKLNRTFTHLVCDEKTYNDNDGFAKTLHEASIEPKIKIVSIDWLVDTLHEQKKQPIRQYLWSKLVTSKRTRSQVMALFQESTADHVRPEQQKALDQELAAKDAAQKERERQERQELEARIREDNRNLLARGGREAHQSEFIEANHIYVKDSVKYEAYVYKASMAANTNERIDMVVFETDEQPHKYSTYLVSEKTGGIILARTLVAYDTNPETAVRQFRHAFKGLTGIKWANRDTAMTSESDGDGFIYQSAALAMAETRARLTSQAAPISETNTDIEANGAEHSGHSDSD